MGVRGEACAAALEGAGGSARTRHLEGRSKLYSCERVLHAGWRMCAAPARADPPSAPASTAREVVLLPCGF